MAMQQSLVNKSTPRAPKLPSAAAGAADIVARLKKQEYVDLEEFMKLNRRASAGIRDVIGQPKVAAKPPGGARADPVSFREASSTIKREPVEIKSENPESARASVDISRMGSRITKEDPDSPKLLESSLNLSIPTAIVTGKASPADDTSESLRSASPQMAQGPSEFIPRSLPPVNEKKERDETWKRFLTR